MLWMRAHIDTHLSIWCPENLSPQNFLLAVHEHMEVEQRSDFRWGIVLMSGKQPSIKPKKRKGQHFAVNTSVPNQWIVYINKSTGCIQTGKPFDLKAREIYHEDRILVNEKTKEGKNAFDVPVELLKMRNSTLRFEPPQPQDLKDRKHFRITEFMTDSNEGIYYYCPSRHLFAPINKFDTSVSFYDPLDANVFKSYDHLHMRIPAKNIWETLSLGPVDITVETTPVEAIGEDAPVKETRIKRRYGGILRPSLTAQKYYREDF